MTPSRPIALAEGVLANVIWASTFVFVKLALTEAGPLTVAGLRYFGGFAILAPQLLRAAPSHNLSRRDWLQLALLGLAGYTIGNGALFEGLRHMPATTGSLLIALTPLPVLLMAVLWLREPSSPLQIGGLALSLAGSVVFLSPGEVAGEPLGIALGIVALISFAAFGALGRSVARGRRVGTLQLTALPLGLGGGLLLLLAVPLEGLPRLSAGGALVIGWLAVVNTVLAYLLYNHALQTLTAVEMNVMFNLGPIGTALMAWPLLGEALTAVQLAGVAMVIAGVMAVQRRAAA